MVELGVNIVGINAGQRITGSYTEPPRFYLSRRPQPGPNGLKLERFVFDALRAAETVCIVETSRDEYGPVKNATGADSPQSSRHALSQRYRGWIEAAGLRTPSPAHQIEIDESRIDGPDELRALALTAIEDAPDHIHTRLGDDA